MLPANNEESDSVAESPYDAGDAKTDVDTELDEKDEQSIKLAEDEENKDIEKGSDTDARTTPGSTVEKDLDQKEEEEEEEEEGDSQEDTADDDSDTGENHEETDDDDTQTDDGNTITYLDSDSSMFLFYNVSSVTENTKMFFLCAMLCHLL